MYLELLTTFKPPFRPPLYQCSIMPKHLTKGLTHSIATLAHAGAAAGMHVAGQAPKVNVN
jgi:hypothetical protein